MWHAQIYGPRTTGTWTCHRNFSAGNLCVNKQNTMSSENSTGYVPFVDQDAYPPKSKDQYNPVPPRPISRELIVFVHTIAACM